MDASGDIVKIKGLTYSWPVSHTTNGVLLNDGAGGLTWTTIGAANITADSLDFTEFKDALALDASTDIALGALTLSTSGTGALSFNNTGLLTVAGNIDFNGTGTNDIAGTLNLSGNALTSSGALTVTPAAGSSLNINLSTTGDFAVNTNQLYVDTSAGNVGIGTTTPAGALHIVSPTSPQLRLGYDASNYVNFNVTSTGVLSIAPQNRNSVVSFTGAHAIDTLRVDIRTSLQVLNKASSNWVAWATRNATGAESVMDLSNIGTLTASGNVGIGTTGPSTKLEVKTVSTPAVARFINTDTSDRGIEIGGAMANGSTVNYIKVVGTSYPLQFKDNSNDVNMVIQDDGNVGIGTTGPSYKLDVAGTGRFTGGLYMEGNLQRLSNSLDDTDGTLYMQYYTAAGSVVIGDSGTDHNLTVYGTGTFNNVLQVAGAGNSYIQGNVGIGTTSPSNLLHAQKDQNVATRVQVTNESTGVSSQAGLYVTNSALANYYYAEGLMGTGFTTNGLFEQNKGVIAVGSQIDGLNLITQKSTAPIIFGTGGNAASNERMRITGTGNVGIGTTSPGAKLNVIADSVSDYATELFNDGNATTRWGLLVQSGLDDQTAAGPSTLVQFNDGDGGAVGSITFGSSVTNYNTSSDVRLKQNIADSLLGIDDLMRIQVRDYTWRADETDRIAHGFIAQELYNIYPDAVTVPKDERFWMVDYSKLTPLIVKSIQDQQGEIEGLGTRQGNYESGIMNYASELSLLTLKTDSSIMTLGELQASVDEELLVVSGSVNTLNDGLATQGEALQALEKTSQSQSDRITALEAQSGDTSWQSAFDMLSSRFTLLDSQMETLADQVASLSDFYVTFELGSVLFKDSLGNVDIGTGVLRAGAIKSSEGLFQKITIEKGSDENALVGKSKIQTGETKIIIETTAVEKDSNILVTPRSAFDGSLAVTDVVDGKSFTVETAKPAETDIPFTWLIVLQVDGSKQ